MKLLFITNLCTHYRIKTFETLTRRMPTQFLFFSQGGERYWNPRLHGRLHGDFPHEYLSGFRLGPVDIAPALPARVWQSDADVILKCILGRFALPASYLVARIRRKPFVLWTGVWSDLTTPFHRVTRALSRYLYCHADAIVVYGEHVKRYLVGLGVRPERVFIAAHALDNDLYNRPVSPAERQQRRELLGLDGRRAILYVGRFDPEKGLTYLVSAVASLARRDTTLVFLGEGPGREELQIDCQAAGVDARFVGYVPPSELYRYYDLADLFVLPSITTPYGREPWGLVVNEAMNQGVPVIASTAVGAAAGGLVRDGETGLVVPERDPAALGAALGRLLNDPACAARLGEAGRREVSAWTNERMVDGFVAAVEFAARARS